jgi:hypothetical protein
LNLLRRDLLPGFCEDGHETSGSIEGKKFVGQLRDIQLLKDSAPFTEMPSPLVFNVSVVLSHTILTLNIAVCWCVHKTFDISYIWMQ